MNANIRQKSFDPARQVYEYDIIAGNLIVGSTQLRMMPSKSAEMPPGFESNVYYEVEEKYRGLGYATSALKKLIAEAKKHGLTQLVLTVNSDNPESIKVIEKCGGTLLTAVSTNSDGQVLKYIIQM